MTGLQFFDAMLRGKAAQPPMATLLGFRLVEVEHGRAVFSGQPDENHCNPMGTVHGGWPSSVLDSCMGCAVHSTLAAGLAFTTVEIKIDFLRPVLPQTGTVKAIGTVVKVGRQVGFAESVMLDEDEKILAKGTSTCLIFPHR